MEWLGESEIELQERQCLNKKRFYSENQCLNHIQYNIKLKLYYYECEFCLGFHTTKRKYYNKRKNKNGR